MSTLAYTTEDLAAPAHPVDEPERRSLWRRVWDALVEARMRRAEREVTLYLQSHGGLLTDDMEREIMRRLSASGRHLS